MAAQTSNDDKMDVISAANKLFQICELVETILLQVILMDQRDVFTNHLTNILIKYRSLNRTFHHVLKTSFHVLQYTGLDVCSVNEAADHRYRLFGNGYVTERYRSGFPLCLPKTFKERPGATYEGDGDDGELFLYWKSSAKELLSFEKADCGSWSSWRDFWFASAKTREVWVGVWDSGNRRARKHSGVKEKIMADRPVTLGHLVDKGRALVVELDSGREWVVEFYQTVNPDGSPVDWW